VRDVVREAFVPLTVNFEGGYIDWLFPDVKRLISTGFGLLLDPMSLAIGLPWRRPDGSLASRDEIAAEWARLKSYVIDNPGSELRSYKTFSSMTTLRLGKEGLYQAFQGKMNHDVGVLRKGFPEYDTWSADAQLAVHSQAWAVGPAFYMPSAGRNYWPKLTAALRARDWRTASVECFMDEEKKNPGIIPRNKANRILFTNAALSADPAVLYWPKDLALIAADEADTLTELPDTEPEPKTQPQFDVVHTLNLPGLPGFEPPPDDDAA
jgi:hypothetical protein